MASRHDGRTRAPPRRRQRESRHRDAIDATARASTRLTGKEKAFVEGETAKAEKEAALVAVIQKDVGEKQRSTAEDLAKAEPAVEAAMAALDSLDPKSLTECKGMIKLPGGVDDVFAASMVLLAGIYPNIQHKKLKVKDRSWDAAKKQCLGNIKEYIEYLKEIKNQVDASADLICSDEGS